MFYSNTLNLIQVGGGTQVKQGDLGSKFSYKLANEKDQELDVFDKEVAHINLVLDDKIVFTTTATVDNSTVTFNIDKAIPVGLYFLEIKIRDYIFPSDKQTIIFVQSGAVAYDLKELVPNYDVNMTLKGILSDLSQKGIDITDLNRQLAQKANKDEVTNVMTPKGTLAYASLPKSGNQVGWYYYCPDGDGVHGAGNYVWNGKSWYFGGTGDEGYNLLKKDLDKQIYAENIYSASKRYKNKRLIQTANILTQTYVDDYVGTEVIGFFRCEKATYDIVVNNKLFKSFVFIMGYDESGNPTGRLANSGGQFTTTSSGYFCLQTNANDDILMESFAIVKHFDGIDYTKIGNASYRFVERKKQSKLYGKKIAVLGDSITSVDYTVPNWWQMIAEETGCIVTNYGVSGTSIAYNEDREQFGHCFAQRYTDMNDDFDIVFVMGGTNDQNRSKLGNWQDSDYTTFYGAMNVLLQGLITKYPNATILFATPIQTKEAWTSGYNNNSFVHFNSGNISASSTMSVQMIAEAIKQKCRQMAVPCKNLFDESGICGFDASNFRADDTLHPSGKGQKKLKIAIQNFWENQI